MALTEATNLNEAVNLLVPDSNIIHNIINEDALTEITIENGTIPSIRKVLADNMQWKSTIEDWTNGTFATDPLQLYLFNGVWYWAPSATIGTTIALGATPVGDNNWKIAPVMNNQTYTFDTIENMQSGTTINGLNITDYLYEGMSIRFTHESRHGDFTVRLAADYTAEIAIDTLMGIYVPITGTDYVAVREDVTIVSVKWFGAMGVGSSFDDSPMFECAGNLAEIMKLNVMLSSVPVYYYAGGYEFPYGVGLIGEYRKHIYNPYSAADMVNTGATIVWNQSYAYPIGFKGNNYLFNFNSYGSPSKLRNGLSTTVSTLYAIRAAEVSFCGFARGVGSGYSVNGGWFYHVHTAQNADGYYTLVDSHIVEAEINANTRGINQQIGGNDNTWTGCKVEWNDAQNWLFYNNTSNVVTGGVCDRAGTMGMNVNNAMVQVSNVKFRRNGKNVLGASGCTHIRLEGGDAKLYLDNVVTDVGPNDDGTGDTTPDHSIEFINTAANALVITGGDLTGCNSDILSNVVSYRPAKMKVSNVIGVDDYDNDSTLKRADNREYFSRVFSGVAVSTLTSFTLTSRAVNTYDAEVMKVLIKMRNASTGGDRIFIYNALVQREGGSASVSSVSVVYESTEGDADTYMTVALTSLNADASSVQLDITHTYSATMNTTVFIMDI
jgi:hypothetical protein